MSLRNAMRKAAGLLVELPEESTAVSNLTIDDLPDLDLPPEARLPGSMPTSSFTPPPKTVEQIVRDADGPNLDEIKVNEAQMNAPSGAFIVGDKLDYTAIYRAAKLPDCAFGAEQMLETMASLPAELPLGTKRATVKAMLSTLGKTMGATPETVVADASRKLAALHSFAEFMERKTGETVSKAEKEILELEAQIDSKKTAIQAARTELSKVTGNCEAESDRLDDVLEFFSLDVGNSKYAPPTRPPAIQPSAVQPPAAR